MKKKGFTLIELLAVIIILAVIALIATPIVLNVVDKTRESARKSSVSGYADATRMAISDYQFANNGTYPEVDKPWAEANAITQGDKVNCEEVHFSTTFGVVLHKCMVGSNTKEYCYASGKTYEDCEDTTYKSIYDSLGNVVVTGTQLVDELKKQYNETNTIGLLKDTDNTYYYKGTNEEVSNNFVWFGGHLWRVLTINTDNTLTMITQQPLTAIQPASAVWTTQAEYEASYINHWLNDETDGVFYKSLEQTDKEKIQDSTFNVGGEYNSTTSQVENINSITTTQKAGLLDENQYTKSGGADSFLDIKDSFWLGNRHSTSRVRGVYSNGNLYDYDVMVVIGVRAVIKISNLSFTEGEGTLTDPYRENSKATNTNNIKVGEYISIPTTSETYCGEDKRCLFRVVGKEKNAIKVILNGLLPSTSAFDSTVTYTSGNTIDNIVTAFASTIDANYRYTGTDKTFGIGTYPGTATNYTVVQTPTYQGNVGLPVVGEMFSGNDIDVSKSTTKTFVNVATIENPTVSDRFWTMNAQNASSVRGVYGYGGLVGSGVAGVFGVRAVLYLNGSSSLTFASGEGTAENPFMLGE